jgi:hypothetical protein
MVIYLLLAHNEIKIDIEKKQKSGNELHNNNYSRKNLYNRIISYVREEMAKLTINES